MQKNMSLTASFLKKSHTRKNMFGKSLFGYVRKPGKQMFWAWIAYQTIKGTLTTSLIWVPLLWAWLH